MKYPGKLEGETPEQMRRYAIARVLEPMARVAFEARSEINSMILGVAQYWNDEADDAVHCAMHYSRRRTPVWPHECGYGDNAGNEHATDYCRWCGGEDRIPGHPDQPEWIPWDDNGSAIPAFEAYCREDCHQEMSTGEAYIPYAIVRRGGGVEIVGRPVRPWHDRPAPLEIEPPRSQHRELLAAVYAAPKDDGARMVLADWLQEHGDPHGEIIALEMRPRDAGGEERLRELMALHGRRILGEIEPCITRSGATIRRGFLEEAEVYIDDEAVLDRASKSTAWGTVESIHFLTGSLQTLSPAMTAERVSGLEDETFIRAGAGGHRIRDLAVTVSAAKSLKALAASKAFPILRRLEVGGAIEPDRVEAVLKGPIAAKLDTLAVAFDYGASTDVDEEGERVLGVGEIGPYLRATARSAVALEIVERGDLGRQIGFRLRFAKDGTLRVSLDNVLGIGTPSHLARVIEVLPSDAVARIELVRSHWFDPLAEDVALLREHARGQSRLRAIEIV